MGNFENIHVSATLRRAFETAAIISDIFDDEYIRSAYVLIPLINQADTLLNQFLSECGIYSLPELLVSGLAEERDFFTCVFGEKAAETFFEEMSTDEEIPEENKQTIEENEISDQNLTEKVYQALAEIFSNELQGTVTNGNVNLKVLYSDKLYAACEEAATSCMLAKQDYLDADHLIYTILKNKESSGYKLLDITLKSAFEEVRAQNIEYEEFTIDDILSYISNHANIVEKSSENGLVVIPKRLQTCCTVLNERYEKGQKSDILNREKEIFKVWSIFSKRTKRNAILIGEAGVGKTAIVEAIVQQIVNEECPAEFLGYQVIELDIGAAIGGTKYRGEFEEKVNHLKIFLEKTPNVILFVDEVHQMMGAGSSEGNGVDLSGALKPILSRSDVIVIGATTIDEYTKFIQRDLAFKRRFEPVEVKQPKHHEVYDMIRARVENLCKYHKLQLEDGVLDYIIVCASAFNLSGKNPDISLDLCDRSMAIAKMRNAKLLQRQDVEKVYDNEFKMFEEMDMETKEALAFHEAGHYMFAQYTSLRDKETPIAISIVPAQNSYGAYIYDICDKVLLEQKTHYLDEIYCLLAGRVSEKFFTGRDEDSGASNDIYRATKIAEKLITEYALDNCKIIFEEDFPYISDVKKDDIYNRIHNMIVEAQSSVETMLRSDPNLQNQIKVVANLLMEKKIVTAKELNTLFVR